MSDSDGFEDLRDYDAVGEAIEKGEIAEDLPRNAANGKLAILPMTDAQILDMPEKMDALWDEVSEPIKPTLALLTGSVKLIYPGESHVLAGKGGTGKSFITADIMHKIVEQDADAEVVFIDYEGNARSFRDRLKALGCTKERAARIWYWQASRSIMQGTKTGDDWLNWAACKLPDLVVIDSVNKATNAAGLNDEFSVDFQTWDNRVIMPLTRLGIATLRIDHVGHENFGSSGGHRTRGSSTKDQAVSGISMIWVAKKSFTKTSNGHGTLKCIKDREGTFEADQIMLNVHIFTGDGKVKFEYEVPKPIAKNADGTDRPLLLMEKLTSVMPDDGTSLSRNKVHDALKDAGSKASRELKDAALHSLVESGFLKLEVGSRGANNYTLIKLFSAKSEEEGGTGEDLEMF